MTQAFFVIPGLLLPTASCVNEAVVAHLNRLTEGAKAPPIRQMLCETPFAGCAHWLWCWRVLTRQTTWFSTAPYRWQATDAPELPGELWRLGFFRRSQEGTRSDFRTQLENPQFLALERRLREPLRQQGFVLQSSDNAFFLSRKTPWGVLACEGEALCGCSDSCRALSPISPEMGEASENALHTLRIIDAILQDCNFDGLDAAWIDGGGTFRYFYPPTKIRSVLSDDPAILGWALAAGILQQRIARLEHASDWPSEAPNGSRLAVFGDLIAPSQKRDAIQWESTLSTLVSRIRDFLPKAKAKGCDEALIVCCGRCETVTWTIQLRGANALWAKFCAAKPPHPKDWIVESVLGDNP